MKLEDELNHYNKSNEINKIPKYAFKIKALRNPGMIIHSLNWAQLIVRIMPLYQNLLKIHIAWHLQVFIPYGLQL